MLCFKNPIVLVTRPKTDSQRLIDALRTMSGSFVAINSPAFENESLSIEIPEFDSAIFTSQAGVIHAPRGNGRFAFCVGDATANAAMDTGYVSISAGGSADDLVALILSQRPDGALLHIRGEITHGEVAQQLNKAGLFCQEVVAYRKAVRGPSQSAREVASENQMIIVPLFSVETVKILEKWALSLDGCTVVAISGPVAGASTVLSPLNTIISNTPDFYAMLQATARLIA